VSEAEAEVAEVRQLREEEDAALLASLHGMSQLWAQLQGVRALQVRRRVCARVCVCV
jgi:pyrroloquinoline quinone (PQQ) biosynthesis protein C